MSKSLPRFSSVLEDLARLPLSCSSRLHHAHRSGAKPRHLFQLLFELDRFLSSRTPNASTSTFHKFIAVVQAIISQKAWAVLAQFPFRASRTLARFMRLPQDPSPNYTDHFVCH